MSQVDVQREIYAALIELLAANDAVENELCNGPDVPGFDPKALGIAQAAVTRAEAKARAVIAKAESCKLYEVKSCGWCGQSHAGACERLISGGQSD